MRDLRVAFWTNKGDFALCPTSFSEVAATQGAAPRPRALLKKVDQNFCAFCQHKTFVSGLNPSVFHSGLGVIPFCRRPYRGNR